MESKGYVASDVTGKPFTDGMGGRNCRLVDPSNPDAAKYIWYVRTFFVAHNIDRRFEMWRLLIWHGKLRLRSVR
jgi:alpha-glucosidase (family GH31 glycosyl hydrolase)